MTTTMNPEIKTRWLARLRSGEIEQATAERKAAEAEQEHRAAELIRASSEAAQQRQGASSSGHPELRGGDVRETP